MLRSLHIMNYFAYTTAARRYAQSRPYFHPLVIDKIKAYLDLQTPVAHALDIGCGTGQSSVALKAIAQIITGIDLAPEMLAEAPRDERIQYVEALAESVPLPDHTADLITISSAFHWFDRERCLQEVYRLLRPGAWLAIYSNGFSGRMVENPVYERWNKTRYVARYPTPPRHSDPMTKAEAAQHGLQWAHHEAYVNTVTFSAQELANYLMTQSNVIAAIEQGNESPADVQAWLLESVTPLFPQGRCTFPFGGAISYLHKAS